MSDWREEARARCAGKMWKGGDYRKPAGRGGGRKVGKVPPTANPGQRVNKDHTSSSPN